jgi:2-hydroxy-6-oxonona-2,4-dienedioate hydrolase
VTEQDYRRAEQDLWASADLAPTEHMVRLPRLGVTLRIQAVGEGEPVLFVHGGPNSGSTWAPLVGRLNGFRSLLLDRPGTGLSEPLDINPGNLADVADVFFADVLDALGIDEAHVVASSFGGFLALRSAAATPDRFGGMVQIACPAGAAGMGMPTFMKAMVAPGLGRLIRVLPQSDRANRWMLRQIGHGKSLDAGRIPPIFLDWYLAMQRHTATMANEGMLISNLASLRGWNSALALPEDLLARVTTPTYFLWGEDDTFGGEDVATAMVAAMPHAELEMVPGHGHLPWLDDPSHAAGVVTRFLSRRLIAEV